MDIKKRLLRRPLTTMLWQVTLIAMALLIGLSGTMVYASNQLSAIMDRYHTTIAVQTYYEHPNEYGFVEPSVSLSDSDVEYLESLDMVEMVDMRTLTGAYIPQLNAQISLIPWGDLHPLNGDYMLHRSLNDSYNQVAVVGTVEESWIVPEDYGYTDLSILGKEKPLTSYLQYAIVNVEEILALNEGYDILPTEEWSSYDGRVFVQAVCYDESEEPWFRPGQRYLVTGAYDPSAHGMYTTVRHTPDDMPLPWIEVWDPWIYNGTHAFMEEDRMVIYQDAVSYHPASDVDRLEVLESVGEPVTLVQRLDGTTEEFLADNPEWAERVQLLQMAQHTFPVLGTEALETMQYFVAGDAAMAEGRMFTREEYDSGARVCVISESLAQASGVKLGDTLSVSQYLVADSYTEGNYSIVDHRLGDEANEPAVGTAIIPDGLVTENESFTVVGIYRLSRSWQDTAFAFTPNTIFIPQKAQIPGGYGGTLVVERERNWTVRYSGMDLNQENIQWQGWEEQDVVRPRGSYGVYMSVKLKNGAMADFQEAISKSVLGKHQFLTFDQGFEDAKGSIHAVIASARKIFWLAVGGWALLMMVYVLLNQSGEKRNLGIMRSVGATVSLTRRYLFTGGFVQALSGVTIGTALTGTVAALVQDKMIGLVLTTGSGSLMQGAEDLDGMLAQSKLTAQGLLILALLQIAVIAAVLWIHTVLLTRKNTRKLLGV